MIEEIEITSVDNPTEPMLKDSVVETEPTAKASSKRKKTLFIILGVVLFLVVLLGGIGLYGYTAAKSLLAYRAPLEQDLAEIKAAAKEQNISKIKDASAKLSTDLEDLKAKIESYSFAGSLPVVKNYYNDAQHGINAGLSGLQAVNLAIEAIAPYSDILGLEGEEATASGGKTTLDRVTFLVTTLDKVSPKLEEIGKELGAARSEMDQIDPNRYPEEFQGQKIRENLFLAINTIDQVSTLVNDAKPFLEAVPDLMGVNSPKHYFVLFQNDGELRPTGGFMTAYGILKVDKGKITPLLSEDIYSLDAAFKKRIPAPDPIKNFHKNVPYLYLRDMNLSPDFAESMKLFMDHYMNNVSGARKDLDGVIAVDTQLLAALVKVTGPIGVPEWGNFSADIDKRCNCPQIVYRLEEIADKPVSTLVTNRKAVIGPLMHSILANAFNSPKEKIAELFNVGLTAIQEKHVLFYLFDEKSQKAVEAFNMAGRVREYDGDYQLLVDTNFAGAKSNLFIKHKIDEKIEISDDGEVTKTLNITYNNPFPASDCGLFTGGLCLNGQYRNWIRLYVPQGSTLIEFTGSEIKANTYEDLGKTVFEGFYGDKYPLRPESMTKVSIKYKLPFKVQKGETYKLLIQKQPGVEKYSMVIDFNGKKEEFDLRGDKEFKW